MTERSEQVERRAPLELGLAVLALGFLVAVLFQTIQLVRERANLATVLANQETPLRNTLALREQVNALAADTAELAQGGNAAAKQVVDEMARQQIDIHPPRAANSNSSH